MKSHTSTQVPSVPVCRACIAGRDKEIPQTFHHDGAVSVSITTPIESLGEKLVLMLERRYPLKGTADNQNFQTQLIPRASPLTLEVRQKPLNQIRLVINALSHRGSSGERVWSPRGQTEDIMGSWRLGLINR